MRAAYQRAKASLRLGVSVRVALGSDGFGYAWRVGGQWFAVTDTELITLVTWAWLAKMDNRIEWSPEALNVYKAGKMRHR